MRLTPTDRDRLLIFTAAELARARRARGLRLNVPEATALIADTVCEAARDGARLMAAAAAGATVLTFDDVLPGVPDIVREVKVEAVFDDGTRMVVVRNPFGAGGSLGSDAPGAIVTAVHRTSGSQCKRRRIVVEAGEKVGSRTIARICHASQLFQTARQLGRNRTPVAVSVGAVDTRKQQLAGVLQDVANRTGGGLGLYQSRHG